MSLSDNDTDEFQQFDVSKLESFDSEQVSRDKDREPDFDRFSLLFEKPAFEPEKEDVFEPFYVRKKLQDNEIFKALIEKEKDAAVSEDETETASEALSPEEPMEPVETVEEKGFRQGFENGYAEGLVQGQEQGYKEGYEKGEAQGIAEGQEKGLEEGLEQGIEQGLKTGAEQADKEIREQAVEILQSLETALNSAQEMLPELVGKYENRIIGLIKQIVKKAVFASLEIDDGLIRSMVLDAMKTLVAPEEVLLSVSEADFEYIEMVKDDFFKEIESLEQVSVRSDPTIERGGCKIETNTATIETDPEQRLEAIFEAIKSSTSG